MTNEIVKKEENKPDILKMELDKIREDYSSPNTLDGEGNLLKEFNNLCKEKTPTEDQKKRKNKLSNEIGMMYGLENGLWASNLSQNRDYQTLARMRQKIIRDYDCKTSLELMLADSSVACYWRIIKNEMRLARLSEKDDGSFSYNQLKINYMKELNKEIDSANRRLNMNIILLKEMKQPALRVNVKTNTAFIGENQQFNNNQNNEAK